MANDYSGAAVVPVLDPKSKTIHNVAVPSDTDLGVLHDALVNSDYAHAAFDNYSGEQPTEEGSVEHSPAFKQAVGKMWEETNLGMSDEEGRAVVDDKGNVKVLAPLQGHDGPMPVFRNTTATIHTHPSVNGVDSKPSQNDIKAAKETGRTFYVASRNGLFAIDPGGKVTQVFNRFDWFQDKKK